VGPGFCHFAFFSVCMPELNRYSWSLTLPIHKATRLRDGRSGLSVFDFWRGLGIFLFTTASRPALGPTQLPIQWVLAFLSPGLKLKSRLHLAPRLLRGTIPPLHHTHSRRCAYLSTGTTLPYYNVIISSTLDNIKAMIFRVVQWQASG
jgi:hypothetical protein